MKAIMIMFDSLNRRCLIPYGCDWIITPNFQRLAGRTVTFTNSFVGSMPCMPARRELHTGRYNFLHRSWGPLEPFDDSMPEILKNAGIFTHLSSDHYHYWEEGGCNYHTRYNTWEFFRGQEGDYWIPDLTDLPLPEYVENCHSKRYRIQDLINRHHMPKVENHPQHRTFRNGLEFLQRNHRQDNWFLTIETFDPHEPFFSHNKYKQLYPHDYQGPLLDWPPYGPNNFNGKQVEHLRYEYAALLSMCDEYLGKVLDFMDTHNMWEDTLLIVNTDHGYLLSEHNAWAKCWLPFYNEVAHTPLFIWDPRSRRQNVRCPALVQTIDLAPTILEYFGINRPQDMQGKVLRQTLADDSPIRKAGLFGIHGGQVNCTDGRYVYMRGPATTANGPLFEYTHMPTHMTHTFAVSELQNIQLMEPFTFTKGCRTMKIAGKCMYDPSFLRTALFDLVNDPGQQHPIANKDIEIQMIKHLLSLMQENDAPPEQYERLGLPCPGEEIQPTLHCQAAGDVPVNYSEEIMTVRLKW